MRSVRSWWSGCLLALAAIGGVPGEAVAQPAPLIQVSTSTLDFGLVPAGSRSTREVVVLYVGSARTDRMQLSVAPPFSASGCNGTLVRGRACTVTVTFRPESAGTWSNVPLTLRTTTSGATAVVNLSGRAEGARLRVEPVALDFGFIAAGGSRRLGLRLFNDGLVPLRGVDFLVAEPFRALGQCNNVAPGATCEIAVEFRPGAGGTYGVPLTITSNADNGPVLVPLTGLSDANFIRVTPPALLFDQRCLPDVLRIPQVVTVGNQSVLGELLVTQVALSGPGARAFFVASSCPASVAPGQSCELAVTYVGTTERVQEATLTVFSNGGNAPVSVAGSCPAPASP